MAELPYADVVEGGALAKKRGGSISAEGRACQMEMTLEASSQETEIIDAIKVCILAHRGLG